MKIEVYGLTKCIKSLMENFILLYLLIKINLATASKKICDDP